MSKTLDSHAYADRLEALADFLRSRPAFSIETVTPSVSLAYWTKDSFVASAKALGPGNKQTDDNSYRFLPQHGINGVSFYIWAPRDVVCRKVQDEKWECDPLLTPEEEAQLAPEVR